jgi:hypothetical protein
MHNPDANVTMPWHVGFEMDWSNWLNERQRHCRVRVKRWKSVEVPKSFRLKTPALPLVPYVPTPYDRSPFTWPSTRPVMTGDPLPLRGYWSDGGAGHLTQATT